MNRAHTLEKSLLSGLMAAAVLISGCSLGNTGETSVTATTETTAVTTEATTTEITEPPVVYDFEWGETEQDLFDMYLQDKLGCSALTYICMFGYTDELNIYLTDFINLYFGKDYKTVPFEEVKYIDENQYNNGNYKWYKEKPEDFKKFFFDSKSACGGVFLNKVIFSYLVQNKLPFGIQVPGENLKALVGGKAYSFDYIGYVEKDLSKNKFDGTERYTVDDLFAIMAYYNIAVLSMDRNSEYQDFVNGYIKEYYGDNAPKFGDVITKEQYIRMFESDPIDLSYIPGAVADRANYYDRTFEIDKDLIGSWTSKTPALTQTFKFNEDGTGVYSSSLKGQDFDLETNKKSNTVRKSENEFTYVIMFKGLVRITYTDGTVKTWSYEFNKSGVRFKDGDMVVGQFKK